jgi:hypothetical protein
MKKNTTLLSIFTFTIYASLLVQVIAGVLNLSLLTYHLPQERNTDFRILLYLLIGGMFVQLVEAIFYGWLVYRYEAIKDITVYRYYDWFITTPTMLVIFVLFLCVINNREMVTANTGASTLSIIYGERYILTTILLLNVAMLLLGYIAERKIIWAPLAIVAGFIPFLIYFAIIYYQYAIYTEKGRTLFWVLVTIWGLYGVSAFLPYLPKNIGYNILDLISKNFFELYLGYILFYGVI